MKLKYIANSNLIQRINENGSISFIPPSEDNKDYVEILEKLESGEATIEPADPEPAPEPTRNENIKAAAQTAKARFATATTADEKINILAAFVTRIEELF